MSNRHSDSRLSDSPHPHPRRRRIVVAAIGVLVVVVIAAVCWAVAHRDSGAKKSESVTACEAALRHEVAAEYQQNNGIDAGAAADRAAAVRFSGGDVRKTIISEDLQIAISSDGRRDSDVDTVWEMSTTVTIPQPLPKNSSYAPTDSASCVMTVYTDGTISVSNQEITAPVGWSTPYTP
ncbi:hypothetical protein ABLE92_15695 [Gordonia sp. VNQ95]|uniref:hypothetical protein n=1 Tax=Gordonia TaxID=2053 RepID=UPI0032B43FAB